MFAMAAICAAATSEKRSNLKVNCKGNLEIVPPAKGAVEVNGKILCDQLSAESIVSPEIKAATDTATNAAAVAEQSAAAAAALELQVSSWSAQSLYITVQEGRRKHLLKLRTIKLLLLLRTEFFFCPSLLFFPLLLFPPSFLIVHLIQTCSHHAHVHTMFFFLRL